MKGQKTGQGVISELEESKSARLSDSDIIGMMIEWEFTAAKIRLTGGDVSKDESLNAVAKSIASEFVKRTVEAMDKKYGSKTTF